MLLNYFKSALAGLVAVFLICGLLPVLVVVTYFVALLIVFGGSGFGIEIPVWHLRWGAPSFAGFLFVFGVFMAGFMWQLRRLTKQKLPPAHAPTDLPTS